MSPFQFQKYNDLEIIFYREAFMKSLAYGNVVESYLNSICLS